MFRIKQGSKSIENFRKEIEQLFVDLTVAQEDRNNANYAVLKPINEKCGNKRFAESLQNSKTSTIIAAGNFTFLKDAVRVAQNEELVRTDTDTNGHQVNSMRYGGRGNSYSKRGNFNKYRGNQSYHSNLGSALQNNSYNHLNSNNCSNFNNNNRGSRQNYNHQNSNNQSRRDTGASVCALKYEFCVNQNIKIRKDCNEAFGSIGTDMAVHGDLLGVTEVPSDLSSEDLFRDASENRPTRLKMIPVTIVVTTN
ncbi:hypothetical protein TcasGA2_TC005252 [Tribolium castaneum]|uniref:Uncharacterized protein n=1 Tax=Tribolium castaneum TaxID=7070 RepID=D7EK46_TRICA|nr:hypothetical protein TcasGA2_TC005252 [Tribolium castaneum]